MNVISPLTLLIVPLIGSLIILSWPLAASSLDKIEGHGTLSASAELPKAGTIGSSAGNNAKPTLPLAKQVQSLALAGAGAGPLSPLDLLVNEGELQQQKQAIVLSSLKKETQVEKRNSNLKKIAIFTSLINFILSIVL
jgi:hypothetical protein